MARVLVTGASGFIGYAVTEALAARGDEVIATDLAIGPRLARLAEQERLPNADISCSEGPLCFVDGTVSWVPASAGTTLRVDEREDKPGVRARA